MTNEIKKVLVVGGAGYVGGVVTDALLGRNIPFSVYDSLLYEHQYLKPLDFIYGDVRDKEKLAKLLPGYSHIIWLAAIVGDGACNVKPELTIQVNQDSVDWLSHNFHGRIVYLSTCSVYGKNDQEVIETSVVNPLSLYAKTKMQAEEFLMGKNCIIFRLGTVFGVSDNYSRIRMDLVVNYMTARAVKNKKLEIFGGDQWRPLIHVKNVGEVVVNSLDKNLTGVYNIATLNYQMKELGKEIGTIMGCQVDYKEMKSEDMRNYHVNTNKAKESGLLSFKKVLNIEDGVREIADLVSLKKIKYTEEDIYFNERHIANLHLNGEFK